MRTDKIRKYVLPNIPYLFIGWAFLKLGTAYRLAAGADFLSKVMGIAGTIAWIFIALLAVGIGVLTSVLLSTLAADKKTKQGEEAEK